MYLAELLKSAILVTDVEEQDVVLIPCGIATWADYNMVVRREMWDKVYVEHRGREPDVEIITRVFTSNPSQEMYRRVSEEPAFKTAYSALRLALDESTTEAGAEEENEVKPMRDSIGEEYEHSVVGEDAELADDIDLQEVAKTVGLAAENTAASGISEDDLGRSEVNDPFAESLFAPEMGYEPEDTEGEAAPEISAIQASEPAHVPSDAETDEPEETHSKKADWVSTVYEDILMTGRVIGDIPEWAAPCVDTYTRMLNDYASLLSSQTLALVLLGNERSSAGMVEEWNEIVGTNCGRTASDADFLEKDKFIQLIRITFVESLRCCESGDFSSAVAYIRVFSDLIYNE